MNQEHYDVVVVGAGIHGAGVAQIFALNGSRVLVLEQYKIASQTSSRSSKLIHGGLRYLETAQFSLVRECLEERDLLLKLAPDLVRLVPFHIPIYKTTSRGALKIRTGLTLYALLGALRKSVRFSSLKSTEWDQLDGLKMQGLRQVFRYYDAQTDDVALTRAVLDSAIHFGATVYEHAELVSAQLNLSACTLDYTMNGSAKSCTTDLLINASGAWVNRVLGRIAPTPPSLPIQWIGGSHIEVADSLQQGIYYVESPEDRRAVFVMPWKEHVLIGTTETVYTGDPVDVVPEAQEREYLLAAYSHYFPAGTNQVINQFAGLRVLPQASSSVFRARRDTQLSVYPAHQPKIITVYGGKLTAYRRTAEKVFQYACQHASVKNKALSTRDVELQVVTSLF